MRAALLGYTVFGLEVGEECYTAADAEQTYKMYGPATNCTGGVGGQWALDVYNIASCLPLPGITICYMNS